MAWQRIQRIFWVGITLLVLAGCQTVEDPIANYRHKTAEALYVGGTEAMHNGNYETAVKNYEALEILYPVNTYAEQVQLNLLYCYYKSDNTAAVAASADRYGRLYPRSEYMPYALYMKALSTAEHEKSILQRWIKPDRAQRDLTMVKQAYLDFKRITEYFPDTPYAMEAKIRMQNLYDMLAAAELDAAKYYFSRGAYVAAVNRVAYLLDIYPQAKQTAEGLAIMSDAYYNLELYDKAADTQAILALNFPEYPELENLQVARHA